MKILLYTTDLFKGREYLMPWRTVLEVAKGMHNLGHSVIIINGINESKYLTYASPHVPIRNIRKSLRTLAQVVQETQADILFMECKWRDALKNFTPLKKIPCKKYVYFTGGIYDLSSIKTLSKLNGVKNARNYWMEILTPKPLLTFRLKQMHFNGAIGLTPFTTQEIKKNGYTNAITILPGKDNFEKLHSDNSILQKYLLTNKKFLCFTGAPAPTRGAQLLLQAINNSPIADLRVVFLMRTDVGSEYTTFDSIYKKMKNSSKVIIIKDQLTREQLKSFFENAWYMILPFVVIPSEIPLTFFEIMSCRTPILTFKNGGTSNYLRNGLYISPKSIEGLSKGITEVWTNQQLREEKAKQAKELMMLHPTWPEVAEQWLNYISQESPKL